MILLPLYWGAKNTLGRSFYSTACCIIMPPTLKKWRAYCSRLVRPSVHVCIRQKNLKARVLKFHIWISHNCAADQRLCFRCTDSTIPLLPKFEISSLQLSSVVVQHSFCGIWSETRALVFWHRGSYFLK